MAASRRLLSCLLLGLLASGCPATSPRPSSLLREPDSGDAESRATQTSQIVPSTHSLGGHSRLRGATPLESAVRSEPSTPESSAPAVTANESPERAVALSGYIDASGDDPSAQSSARVEPANGANAGAEDNSSAAAESAETSTAQSPWGLSRIPDVWDVTRRIEESTPTDWTWGLGQHLRPDTQTEDNAADAAEVKTASLPEDLTQDAPVWGGESSYSQEELSKLISLIEAELANAAPNTESQRRDYIRRQVLLRNLYLLAGRPHEAQQAIAGIDPADQEFWSEMCWAMSSYFDEEMLPSRSDRAAQTVARLGSAQRALEPLVPLEIRNMQFCRQIHGFGSYEAFGINEFTAGQAILLYTEMRHFNSEPDPSGVYQTVLESEIEIYADSPTRERVDRTVFPATEDLCRSPREDYFHSYRIDLPGTLSPGAYVLQLTVTDRLAGKSATESRRFFIVPAASIQ